MPPSNIYETNLAYHIDVEVPGVVNITSFQIQWPNLSTLMIEAKATPQPLVHCGREENGGTIREEKKEAENAVANMNSKSKSDDDGGGVATPLRRHRRGEGHANCARRTEARGPGDGASHCRLMWT